MALAEDGALACALICLGPIVTIPDATRIYNVHSNGLCRRGHSLKIWEAAYTAQRKWLASLQCIPWYFKITLPVYAVIHHRMAKRLELLARYTT